MIEITANGKSVLCATEEEAAELIMACEDAGFEIEAADDFDLADNGYVPEEILREADKFAAYG